MKYDNFELHADPRITNAYCSKCRATLIEVRNGWVSTAMFCPKCESVFQLKLIKTPDNKVTKEFLRQTWREVQREEIELQRKRKANGEGE